MSSFYGAGGNVTVNVSGGSGDSSFTTLTGTTSSPIVLSTLDYGNYLLEGNYSYTSSDTNTKTSDYQMLVTIIEDSVTSYKVAKFEICEDGVFYIYTVTFYDDGTYIENKQSFVSTEGVTFLADAELPSTGVSGVLYVTETAIYRWSEEDQDYINLSSPSWNELE